MKKNISQFLVYTTLFAFIFGSGFAQSLEPFEVTDVWLTKIEQATPAKPMITTKNKRKILLFSLFTGFDHWVIPHTDVVIKTIAKKTGAFEVAASKDISVFNTKYLSQFDAIVLNNNCSIGPRRDLFYDALTAISDTILRAKKAGELERNLLDYVKKGGGLVVLHGGIVMQNNSENVSEMTGGSFDYHPAQQLINVKLVDAKHPMVQPFGGEGFKHVDEPYFFKNAYFDFNFRPLLYIETKELEIKKKEENIKYVSWIKRYGNGRVFYSSPSHNAQSYDTALIAFLMNGMQYATGDLKCDDSPIKVNPN